MAASRFDGARVSFPGSPLGFPCATRWLRSAPSCSGRVARGVRVSADARTLRAVRSATGCWPWVRSDLMNLSLLDGYASSLFSPSCLRNRDRRPRVFFLRRRWLRVRCAPACNKERANAVTQPNSCVVTGNHPSTLSQVRNDNGACTHCAPYTRLRNAHLRVPGLRSLGKRGGAFRRRWRICGSPRLRRNTCSDSN
jgi:hypothetical protein